MEFVKKYYPRESEAVLQFPGGIGHTFAAMKELFDEAKKDFPNLPRLEHNTVIWHFVKTDTWGILLRVGGEHIPANYTVMKGHSPARS